jgi:predicted aspartyl protease
MRRWAAAAVLATAACGGTGGGRHSPESDPAGPGTALYIEGKLDAAERELSSVISRDPGNSVARRILGRILLLKGRHRESAQQFLSYVSLTRSSKVVVDSEAVQDLFWALYRMDDFALASKAAENLDDSVFAVKYAEISKRGPAYATEWRQPSSVLSFEGTGTATARINGLAGRFALDLGAGEIVLDRDFAERAGVRIVGVPSPSIERVEQGIVESVDLSALQVRNVPVVVSQLRGGVDGVLGVSFLSHFQTTIDYRRHRAVLRAAASEAREGETWPLLFAGDRTLLTAARIDGIDTFVIINPTARGVKFIPSQAMLLDRARRKNENSPLERVEIGALSIGADGQTADKFPSGVDVAYGFIIGGMVGAEAFRNRSVTFDFRAMTITVE